MFRHCERIFGHAFFFLAILWPIGIQTGDRMDMSGHALKTLAFLYINKDLFTIEA